jgi:hypothetical protein
MEIPSSKGKSTLFWIFGTIKNSLYPRTLLPHLYLIVPRYYPVKWHAHITKFHELLQLRADAKPLTEKEQSVVNTYLYSSIFPRLKEEGKAIHEGKRLAPQLSGFSTNYDILALDKQQRVQMIVELLLPYKSTFGSFNGAIEWACTTCKLEIANVIIEHYPDLVKAGTAVWAVSAGDVQV